jgi:molybdenum cofactor synthesis domain-containing protein
MNAPAEDKKDSQVTAALLVIGNELLSGRTQDVNLQTLAKFLAPLGIDLCEARFVPDVQREIVDALNALRARYSYVFTTGGIGPTHDDITADAIAAAFGVGIDYHDEALVLLAARYGANDFTDGRKRMARIPLGASLIKNPVSVAPGFQIENVFVMAGVPRIMAAMLADIEPRLRRGRAKIVRSLTAQIAEGRIAVALAAIQKDHPDTDIGSYPFFNEKTSTPETGRPSVGTTLVVSGRNGASVQAALAAIAYLVRQMGVEPQDDGQSANR